MQHPTASDPHSRSAGGPRSARGQRPGPGRVRSALHSLALLALTLAAACSSPREELDAAGTAVKEPTNDSRRTAPPAPPPLQLPDPWQGGDVLVFEDFLDSLAGRSLAEGAVDELLLALRDPAPEAVPDALRAVLVLSRAQRPEAAEAFLARLEQRLVGPERAFDAADVVAAAALARMPLGVGQSSRLTALAAGPAAHPDLETRVECAASALHHGSRVPVPFLLAVLRIDTRAGWADRRDFEVSSTTAWARWRAAEALSRAAGVPCTYRTEASVEEREREALALEQLLIEAPSGDDGARH